jgi:hypothetical protein
MIKPTIGRVVLYYPGNEVATSLGMTVLSEQPMDAHVVHVWDDRLVNLAVFDHAGKPWALGSVKLLQDGDDKPNAGESYAEWMPYQKGQAAKYEALEREKGAATST